MSSKSAMSANAINSIPSITMDIVSGDEAKHHDSAAGRAGSVRSRGTSR